MRLMVEVEGQMAIPADIDYNQLPMRLDDGRYLVVLKSRDGMVQYYRDPDLAEAAQDSDRRVLLLDKQIAWMDLPWWKRLVTPRP